MDDSYLALKTCDPARQAGRGRQYLFTRYEVSPSIRNRTVELDTRSETRLPCDGSRTFRAEPYWLAAYSTNKSTVSMLQEVFPRRKRSFRVLSHAIDIVAQGQLQQSHGLAETHEFVSFFDKEITGPNGPHRFAD